MQTFFLTSSQRFLPCFFPGFPILSVPPKSLTETTIEISVFLFLFTNMQFPHTPYPHHIAFKKKNACVQVRLETRLSKTAYWDQTAFNEEIFFLSHGEYKSPQVGGLHWQLLEVSA